MATTTNVSINKVDGWVSIATDPGACSITSNTKGVWYVAIAATTPGADVFGERMGDYDSYVTGTVAGTIYVRVVGNETVGFGVTVEAA